MKIALLAAAVVAVVLYVGSTIHARLDDIEDAFDPLDMVTP